MLLLIFHWPAEGGKRMNVLFTKRRSIIAPTARGNYPVQFFFFWRVNYKKYGTKLLEVNT